MPIDRLGLQIAALFETAAPSVSLSELDPAVSSRPKETNRWRIVVGVVGAIAAVVVIAWAVGAGADNRVVAPSTPQWTSVEFPAGAAEGDLGVVVSTGDDIIFWGGQSDGAPETPGAEPGLAYNLETGLWRDISPSPKQTAWGNAGVWTGSEVIITGGAAGSSQEPRTVAYDPGSDSWRVLADSPISGVFTDAVWTGSQVLVVVSDAVAAYDPETDHWEQFPEPPDLGSSGVPFQGPWRINEVIWTGDELIIWSGDVERTIHRGISLDPATGEWQMLPDPPAWPAAPSLVWTGDRAVLWGGVPSSSGGSERAVGSVYEPDSDRWTEMAEALPEPEAFEGNLGSQSMLWTGDRVLASTGAFGSGVDPDRSLLLSYDPADNTWEYVGVAPTSAETWGARSIMAGDRVVLISDRLYLSQPGWVPGGEPVSADTWPTTTTTTVPPETTTSVGITTTTLSVQIPAEGPLFGEETGVTLLFDDGYEGVVAVDPDLRRAARSILEGQRPGDEPYSMVRVGDKLVVGWGFVYSVDIASGQATSLGQATIFVPAAESDRVWMVDYPSGSLDGGLPQVWQVDLEGHDLTERVTLDAIGSPTFGVAGGLVLDGNTPGLTLWDLQTSTTKQLEGEGSGHVLDVTGDELVWCTKDCSTLVVTNTSTLESEQFVVPDGYTKFIGAAQASFTDVEHLSPDARYLAALVGDDDLHGGRAIWVLDRETGMANVVSDPETQVDNLTWAPDGDQLFATSWSYDQPRTVVWRYQPLTQDFDAVVVPVGGLLTPIAVNGSVAQAYLDEPNTNGADCLRGQGELVTNPELCTLGF